MEQTTRSSAEFVGPSTNIGAAHPVNIQGGADTSSVMNDKVTNDAVAQVKGLAEKRGRNIEWAEKAVRESVSITEQEALDLNVIDFISPSIDSLLSQMDGMEVEIASGEVQLSTRDARIIYRQMNFGWNKIIMTGFISPNYAQLIFCRNFFKLSQS